MIAVETFLRAGPRGWVRYCKESSGDLDYLAPARDRGRRGRPEGLRRGGTERRGRRSGSGAAGLVPVCANIEPETYTRLWEPPPRGDAGELRPPPGRASTSWSQTIVLGGPCWLSGPKYALARLGIGRGTPLSPLQPVEGPQAGKSINC